MTLRIVIGCRELKNTFGHKHVGVTGRRNGFGGLEVACWPLGSNPAEAVGFFRAKNSSARLPSEGK